MKCLTCKKNGTNKCSVYKNGDYIGSDCPEYEESNNLELFYDNCQVFITEKPHLCVPCLICGEPVELSEFESYSQFVVKVCDKCKKAIMKLREELENE